jgi:hypothetical protein
MPPWTCSSCTFINSSDSLNICEVCGSPILSTEYFFSDNALAISPDHLQNRQNRLKGPKPQDSKHRQSGGARGKWRRTLISSNESSSEVVVNSATPGISGNSISNVIEHQKYDESGRVSFEDNNRAAKHVKKTNHILADGVRQSSSRQTKCRDWTAKGICARGIKCQFLHNYYEQQNTSNCPAKSDKEAVNAVKSVPSEAKPTQQGKCHEWTAKGACSRVVECKYVHNSAEHYNAGLGVNSARPAPQVGPPVVNAGGKHLSTGKQNECREWNAKGSCARGDKCKYAHATSELMVNQCAHQFRSVHTNDRNYEKKKESKRAWVEVSPHSPPAPGEMLSASARDATAHGDSALRGGDEAKATAASRDHVALPAAAHLITPNTSAPKDIEKAKGREKREQDKERGERLDDAGEAVTEITFPTPLFIHACFQALGDKADLDGNSWATLWIASPS